MLGEVIGKIFSSLLPVEAKCFLLDATLHPVEVHVKCFGAFPAYIACEDDVRGCVVSRGWPISFRVVRMATGCWLLRKITPVSALPEDDITVRMVWHLVRIGPFRV